MYRTLDPHAIVETAQTLNMRISERFPESGLSQVSAEVLELARALPERLQRLAAPHWPVRIAVTVILVILATSCVMAVKEIRVKEDGFVFSDIVQLSDAGMNVLVLAGAALIFLFTLERRLRRSRTLVGVHELRALAHVVDMHQLTKDPYRVSDAQRKTSSSPKQDLTPFELSRYLDYCSETFSIIGKLAALYANDLDDATVIASVNDVETLTTGLSRKVWQKIMIVQSQLAEGAK